MFSVFPLKHRVFCVHPDTPRSVHSATLNNDSSFMLFQDSDNDVLELDGTGNLLDGTGSVLDAAGNVLDCTGNVLDGTGNVLLSPVTGWCW